MPDDIGGKQNPVINSKAADDTGPASPVVWRSTYDKTTARVLHGDLEPLAPVLEYAISIDCGSRWAGGDGPEPPSSVTKLLP
jgi:hypothetical protein